MSDAETEQNEDLPVPTSKKDLRRYRAKALGFVVDVAQHWAIVRAWHDDPDTASLEQGAKQEIDDILAHAEKTLLHAVGWLGSIEGRLRIAKPPFYAKESGEYHVFDCYVDDPEYAAKVQPVQPESLA